ncbi:MAG: hypothetical protein WCO57_09180 [Verrucomicrobiota bacterium]
MTEPQPPTEGSSLSPRHRPDLKTLVKNSTEQDLWDLDESPSQDPAAPVATIKTTRATAPRPVAAPPIQPGTGETPPTLLEVPLLPRHNIIHSPRLVRRGYDATPLPPAAPAEPASPLAPFKKVDMLEDAFHHLDDWHLANELTAAAPARPLDDLPMALPEPVPAGSPEQKPATPATPAATAVATAAVATAPVTDRDEFSPKLKAAATPLLMRPKLGLSKMEMLGLTALALVLLLGGFWVYQNSLSRLHTQATQTRKITFPVQGRLITVTKVVTYWRAPINKKGQVETVRRGVVLIPVTELTLRGGPAAIRVLVHNDSGVAVGDPITRQVDGETTLTLAATDGFEDISMHAVYLTAQSKPWTLQLFEAASANAPKQDFIKLLEVPISTEKH